MNETCPQAYVVILGAWMTLMITSHEGGHSHEQVAYIRLKWEIFDNFRQLREFAEVGFSYFPLNTLSTREHWHADFSTVKKTIYIHIDCLCYMLMNYPSIYHYHILKTHNTKHQYHYWPQIFISRLHVRVQVFCLSGSLFVALILTSSAPFSI